MTAPVKLRKNEPARGPLRQTTVQLHPAILERMRRVARERQIPMRNILRDALMRYFEAQP